MIEDGSSPKVDIWISAVIIVRVVVILVLWIVLFLTIFMGYFTFPIILIGIVTVVYMLTDLGIYWVMKRRQRLPQRESTGVEPASVKQSKEE